MSYISCFNHIQENNPHFQLAFWMKAVQADESMFPQVLKLAVQLNRVKDLQKVFYGTKYKSFNLLSLIPIIMIEKQYELALFVAMKAYTTSQNQCPELVFIAAEVH